MVLTPIFLLLIPVTLALHDRFLTVPSYTRYVQLSSYQDSDVFHLSYSVHRCVATTRDQVELLASLSEDEELEFWTEPSLIR